MQFILEDRCRGNLADVNMWSALPKSYDWELLTAAWEYLGIDPNEVNDFKGYKRQVELFAAPAADLSIILMGTVFSKITEEDIKNFKLSLEIAREELHLHYTYLADTYLITHNSSVKDVMKSIPSYKFIDDFEITCMVKDVINVAKKWYENNFCYYDFQLFLPTCKFIKGTTPLLKALKKLKADPSFRKSTFKDLSDGMLEEKLKCYLSHLQFCKDKDGKSSFKHAINEEYEYYRKRYLNVMYNLRVEFHTPAHFLIHQELFMGYAIGHPIAEITKLRVYLDAYVSGVPPPLLDECSDSSVDDSFFSSDDSMDSSSSGTRLPPPPASCSGWKF